MEWLEQTNSLLSRIAGLIDDEGLSDWNAVIERQGMMAVFTSLCPDGIGAELIMDADAVREGGDHHAGCSPFLSDPEHRPLVNGTLDAADDPVFEEIYRSRGWRTVIYVIMDVRHRTNPVSAPSESDILADNPLVLYSKAPNALNPDSISRLYISARWMFSAMLLRLGLTLSSNAYERMKNVVPGALLTISNQYIYDANDESIDWFDIDRSNPLNQPATDVLPDVLLSWVRDRIRDRVTRDNRFVTTIMELQKRDGTPVIAEVMLRRTGAFEHLQLNERMQMARERITLSEASAVHHFLVVRDVTKRWEAEKMEQEMALARRMQMNLLPARLPVSDLFELAAQCRPASHVGGDVYDVAALDGEQLTVFLGDAVGHGTDSALLAATAMGAYRTAVQTNPDPEAVLTCIDNTLRVSNQSGFITAGCLLINPAEHRLRYGLAGQPRPIIIRRGHLLSPDDTPSSLPLGVKLNPSYCTGSVQLMPGDLIALPSDGILEMRNPDGVTFESSFISDLRLAGTMPLTQWIAKIFNAMDTFRGPLKQEDDLTLVMIRI